MNLQPKFPSSLPFSKMYVLLFGRLPVLLATAIGYWFAIQMFADINKDTMRVPNNAATVTALLTLLSFTCARALGSEEDKQRDRFAYAGERFFQASLLFLLASGLKYVVSPANVVKWVETTAGVFAAVFFAYGVMNARTGLQASYDLLAERYTRHPDWDEII